MPVTAARTRADALPAEGEDCFVAAMAEIVQFAVLKANLKDRDTFKSFSSRISFLLWCRGRPPCEGMGGAAEGMIAHWQTRQSTYLDEAIPKRAVFSSRAPNESHAKR